jgi:hypothetical protein
MRLADFGEGLNSGYPNMTRCVCVCVVPTSTFGPRTWSGHPQASINMTSFPSTFPAVSCFLAVARAHEAAYVHFIGAVTCKWVSDNGELHYTMRCTLLGILLTPWSRLLLEQLTKEMRRIYVIQSSITVFTRARHISVFWARAIQSTPPIRCLEEPFNY